MTQKVSEQRVAILTGAASGMGKGVAQDLARKGWKVVILDYAPDIGQKFADEINGDFFAVDVRNWKQQYEAFETTFRNYGRLDFVHGNAGKAEAHDYFDRSTSFTANEPPNMECLDINLLGVSYTTLLAIATFRRNPPNLRSPLLVLTASAAGLYPTPVQPFYSAAKHAVVGLARSLGHRLESEGIRVCALAPGLVPTPIMPREIIDRVDPGVITPVSTIVRAINDMLDNDRTATVCEVSVETIYYRDPVDFPDEAQKKVVLEVSPNMAEDFRKLREANAKK